MAKFRESVVLVVKEASTGRTVKIVEAGPNVVTTQGDKFYARRGAGETVNTNSHPFHTGQMIAAATLNAAGKANKKTATFGNIGGAALDSYSGRQDFDNGYPKTADTDTDNTARTVDGITYKRVYSTSQANQTIYTVGLCRTGAQTNSSGQLLAVKTLSMAQSVVKTSSLTLTIYVTHVFLGA